MEARPSENEQPRGGAGRLMVFLRRLLAACAVVAIAFAAFWFWAKQQVHEEIRKFVRQKFADHYGPKGFSVTVSSARLIEGRGIEVRSLTLHDATTGKVAGSVDSIFLECDARMQDLLSGMPQVKLARIRNPHVYAVRRADGSWSAKDLFPLPKFGNRPPPISIEGGILEISDSSPGGALRVYSLRRMNIKLEPESAPSQLAEANAGAASLRRRIHGTLAGDHVRTISVEGWVDFATGDWSLDGEAKDVDFSPALHASLPQEMARHLGAIEGLQARLQVKFSLGQEGSVAAPFRFSLSGKLTDGRLHHPRVPYPLTDMSAQFRCDATRLEIENLTANCGTGKIDASCRRAGHAASSPVELHVVAKNMMLDNRLVAVLPEEMQTIWADFSPRGAVDATLDLTFDGHTWKPALMIRCLDASFAYRTFPYRIRGCTGTVALRDNVCDVDLKARAGGRELRIKGQYFNPGKNYTGGVDVTVDGPMPINDELLSALDDQPEKLVRSFRPRGTFTANATFGRRDRQQPSEDVHVVFTLYDCSAKYEGFPYPFDRITGTVEMINNEWYFRNLEGRNGSAVVRCNGSWKRSASGDGLLDLVFGANSVPLEEELRLALNRDARRVWSELRPRGTIDDVKLRLRYDPSIKKLAVNVSAVKRPQRDDIEGSSVTVHPVWFPYRLDNLSGTFTYDDGKVALENVRGLHGRTAIRMAGHCSFSSRGWNVTLNEVDASGLRPDHEFLAALPTGLREAVTKLNLTGLLSINGGLAFVGGNRPDDPVRSTWDLLVDLEDGDLDCGVRLDDIHGAIKLVGDYDGKTFFSRGELDVDSVIFRDVQLTQVKGPVWIDGQRVGFGAWSEPRGNGQASRHVTARMFGGGVSGDAQIAMTGDAPFDLRFTLTDGELGRFSRELAPRLGNVAGKVYAGVRLSGNSKGSYTWKGDGFVRLREANVYQVPALLSLLKLLSIRRPDRTAFTESNMDFDIEGEDINFRRIDFTGDAISLKGKGWMNMDGQIDMRFYTIVGRDDFYLPIVRPLLGLASQQFLMMEVDGTIDNPNRPRQKVLPGIDDTLRQLFPEIAQPGTRSAREEGRPLEAMRPGSLRRQ